MALARSTWMPNAMARKIAYTRERNSNAHDTTRAQAPSDHSANELTIPWVIEPAPHLRKPPGRAPLGLCRNPVRLGRGGEATARARSRSIHETRRITRHSRLADGCQGVCDRGPRHAVPAQGLLGGHDVREIGETHDADQT